MSQTYSLPNGSNSVSVNLLTNAYNSLEALRSTFSGANPPTNPAPVEGQLFYDTVNDLLKIYDGSTWNSSATGLSAASDATITGAWTHRNSIGVSVLDLYTNGPTVPLRTTVFIDGYSVAPGIIGRKASGTEASPTNTKINDDICLMISQGYTGSGWTTASGYAGMYATQNWSPTANGTSFVVGLTADGETVRTPYPIQRFIIKGTGHALINAGTADPSVNASALLELRGTTGALLLPELNPTQRNALTASNGMLIYLTGYGLHTYTLGGWQNVVTGGGPDIYSTATGFVGINGAPGASCKLDINGTNGALRLSRLTIAQRAALTASNGMMFYLSDTGYNDFQMYRGSTWVSVLPAIGYEYDIKTTSTSRMGLGIGGGSISTSAILELSSTTGTLLLSRMTQAQRDALTPVNGMLLYVSDYNDLQARINGAWASILPATGYSYDIKTTSSSRVGLGIGAGSISASAILELSSTTGTLLLSRMTQSQRDALTPVNGMILYISDYNDLQARINGGWRSILPSSGYNYDITTGTSGRLGLKTASITASATLEIAGTDGALLLPRLTTTQRGALTGASGMLIYNTTSLAMQANVNSSWGNLVFDPTGAITITSGRMGIGGSPNTSATLDIQGTTGAILVPRLTTTERDALTATNGMLLYNTTLNKFQAYEGGAWANII